MPKIVDHLERRAAISTATWVVIERDGLAGVTLRSVAAEAGISLGVLGHYFASKEDILLDAHRMAFDRALERVRAATSGMRGLSALETAVLEALPLDGPRRLKAQVDIAFLGMCLTQPTLARVRRQSADGLRDLIVRCLSDARRTGELRVGVDDALTADECIALIDGASTMGLLSGDDPSISDRLRVMAHEFVDRLRATPNSG